MANCERWQERVSAYVDDACDARERQAVEAHLAECRSCREWLEQMRADAQVFREAMTAGQADLAEPVMREVAQMAPAGVPRAARPGLRHPWPVMQATAAAAAVLVLIIGGMAISKLTLSKGTRAHFGAPGDARMLGAPEAGMRYAPAPAQPLEKPPGTAWDETVSDRLVGDRRARGEDAGPPGPPGGVGMSGMPGLPGAGEPPTQLHEGVAAAGGPTAESGTAPTVEQVRAKLAQEPTAGGEPVLGRRYAQAMPAGAERRRAPWQPSVSPQIGQAYSSGGPGREMRVAYDAACEVWVEDLQEAVPTAERAFYDHKGFVLSSELVGATDPEAEAFAEIIGKVPTDQVADTVNAITALGYVAQRDVRGQDMTQEYLEAKRAYEDLLHRIKQAEARLAEAKGSEKERLQAQVTRLHEELRGPQDRFTAVEGEIELATITATLVEREPYESEARTGVRRAWQSFLDSGATLGVWLIWGGLYALFLVPVIVVIAILRARRRPLGPS